MVQSKFKSSLCLTLAIMIISFFTLSPYAEAATVLYSWRGSTGGVTAGQTKNLPNSYQGFTLPSNGDITILIDQYSQNSNVRANATYYLKSTSGKTVRAAGDLVTGNHGGSAGAPKDIRFYGVQKGTYYIVVVNNSTAGLVTQGDVHFSPN